MGDLAPKVDVPATLGRIAAKTAIASVPVLGPFLSAVLDEVLPAFRAERLTVFSEELRGRLQDVPLELLMERIREPERFDLLEDGLWQSARTSDRDRLAEIANVIANGLSRVEARAEERRYVLRLLGEMNDVEVLTLCSYGYDENDRRATFCEQHAAALDYERAVFGSPLEVIDRDAVRQSFEDHLLHLGLLQESGGITVDDHFRGRGQYRELSQLGRLVLREIGRPADLDLAEGLT